MSHPTTTTSASSSSSSSTVSNNHQHLLHNNPTFIINPNPNNFNSTGIPTSSLLTQIHSPPLVLATAAFQNPPTHHPLPSSHHHQQSFLVSNHPLSLSLPHPSSLLSSYQPTPTTTTTPSPLQPQRLPPRRSGICKFFNLGKGFGFIQDSKPEQLPTIDSDPGTDIFVHYTCISLCEAPFKSLLDGEQVEYYLGRSNKGLAALDVTGPNNSPVKGSKLHGSRSQTILTSAPPLMMHSPLTLLNYPSHLHPQAHIASFPSPTMLSILNPTRSPQLLHHQHPSKSSRSPNHTPVASPLFSSPADGPVWTVVPSRSFSSSALSHQSQTNISPTFGLAVGSKPGHQLMRREVSESLGVVGPSGIMTPKMSRISSAPGQQQLQHASSTAPPPGIGIGIGIGIGVAWEPKSRRDIPSSHLNPTWSPPGRRTSFHKDASFSLSNFSSSSSTSIPPHLHHPSLTQQFSALGLGKDRSESSNWRSSPRIDHPSSEPSVLGPKIEDI